MWASLIIGLVPELVRGVISIVRDAYAAKKAEEERRKAEAEAKKREKEGASGTLPK